MQDQARTVILELDDMLWDADCDFPDCPYAVECPIGKQLSEIQKEHTT